MLSGASGKDPVASVGRRHDSDPPDFRDRTFSFCKLMYDSVRSGQSGMGWSTDYPYAGINLMIRLSELTRTEVSMDGEDEPNHCGKHGRLMVVMTHNTDIGDSWEREAEDPGFFYQFSPNGYALGVDVLLYAMTH